jgi:hypothetical protein
MATHSPRDGNERITVDALTAIAERFDHDRVRYLIVGGLAVIAHGYVRLTMDIDIVLSFADGNERRAIAGLKDLGYRARIPEPIESFTDPAKRAAWTRDKDMLVFTVMKNESEVDLFLNHPFAFDDAYANAVWATARDDARVRLPFVDIDRLIDMKRQAGRPQDLIDLEHLVAFRTALRGREGKPS